LLFATWMLFTSINYDDDYDDDDDDDGTGTGTGRSLISVCVRGTI